MPGACETSKEASRLEARWQGGEKPGASRPGPHRAGGPRALAVTQRQEDLTEAVQGPSGCWVGKRLWRGLGGRGGLITLGE